MFSPAGMSIATITVMLWLIWSDALRARRSTPILYAMRIALYLVVSAILVLNMIRYPELFRGTSLLLAIVAVIIGLVGAGYFGRKLVRRA